MVEMEQLNEFDREIANLIAAEEKKVQLYRRELSVQHDKRKERLKIFSTKSEQIMTEIIRPHVEKVVGYFENASCLSAESQYMQCVYRFESIPRSPATTTLSFTISHDSTLDTLWIEYGLRILPIFMEFEKEDSITFELTSINESECRTWVEKKLLLFIEMYLQLGHIEQYQQQNLVIDPICGVQINQAFAIAEETTAGLKHFFCSSECRQEYASMRANPVTEI